MKKFLSIIVTIILVLTLMPNQTANASTFVQEPFDGCWARIRYFGDFNKCLDVPAQQVEKNGTQLQLWDYTEGNQNQLFYFEYSANGWIITSHASGKVIEVRNSSHSDYAKVQQWTMHDLNCARWDIIHNADGTVSFKNKESGLYLNVEGGGYYPENGTKLIQYHDDGTIANKFYLEVMTGSDILVAEQSVFSLANIAHWTAYDRDVIHFKFVNETGWFKIQNGKYYYPTPYCYDDNYESYKIYDSIRYLSSAEVQRLYDNYEYWEDWDEEFYNFLDALDYDVNGNLKPMTASIYYEIVDDYSWYDEYEDIEPTYNIIKIECAEYKSCNKLFNSDSVIRSGGWEYKFR